MLTAIQALILACWHKIAKADWLKYTYSVAVTKLDTLFADRVSTTSLYSSQVPKMRKQILSCIEGMKDLISPFLLHPTRAVKRFHPGSDLLKHWDLYNLKKVALAAPAVSSVAKRRSSAAPSQSSESVTSSSNLPNKRSKRTSPTFDAPTTGSEKSSQSGIILEDTVSQFQLLASKRAEASANLTINQLKKAVLESQVREEAAEGQARRFQRELKVNHKNPLQIS